MYYFVLTTVELYRKLNFQKENINNTGLDDNPIDPSPFFLKNAFSKSIFSNGPKQVWVPLLVFLLFQDFIIISAMEIGKSLLIILIINVEINRYYIQFFFLNFND